MLDPILIELKTESIDFISVCVCLNLYLSQFPVDPFTSFPYANVCVLVVDDCFYVCLNVCVCVYEFMCVDMNVNVFLFGSTINENISIGNECMFVILFYYRLPVIRGILPFVVYMPAYPTVCAPKLWPIK